MIRAVRSLLVSVNLDLCVCEYSLVLLLYSNLYRRNRQANMTEEGASNLSDTSTTPRRVLVMPEALQPLIKRIGFLGLSKAGFLGKAEQME